MAQITGKFDISMAVYTILPQGFWTGNNSDFHVNIASVLEEFLLALMFDYKRIESMRKFNI